MGTEGDEGALTHRYADYLPDGGGRADLADLIANTTFEDPEPRIWIAPLEFDDPEGPWNASCQCGEDAEEFQGARRAPVPGAWRCAAATAGRSDSSGAGSGLRRPVGWDLVPSQPAEAVLGRPSGGRCMGQLAARRPATYLHQRERLAPDVSLVQLWNARICRRARGTRYRAAGDATRGCRAERQCLPCSGRDARLLR